MCVSVQWRGKRCNGVLYGHFAAVGQLLSLRYQQSPPEILMVKAPHVPIFGLDASAKTPVLVFIAHATPTKAFALCENIELCIREKDSRRYWLFRDMNWYWYRNKR